jgi:O-antigen/teichoic acid export membrane protein
MLYVAVLLVAGLALWHWRGAGELALMAGAAFYLLGFAIDVAWYMRALEHTRALLVITTCVRLLGIAVLLIVVARLATMESALWAYGAVSVLTSVLTWSFLVHRGLMAATRIEFGRMFVLLRESAAIVFGNLNAALMTNGGVALLGLLADPAVVGAANLALRVRTASQAALLPLQQLGFVRLSASAGTDPARSIALGRRLLWPTLGLAVAVAAVCAFGAEPIARFVFKADVPLAALMIVVLAFTGPIQAMANLFGMQSLIAFGRERSYALIQVAASIAFLAVLLLVPSQLAYGWALGAGECVVMVLAGLQMCRIARQQEEKA